MNLVLDNKQRAHDFACATFHDMYESKVKQLLDNTKPEKDTEAHIDILDIYMELYEASLDFFNKQDL